MEEFTLFEVSWEVCNKVGGIYTVVKSKASVINSRLKRNYILIGPYIPGNSENDFEEKVPPPEVKDIFNSLKEEGIMCKYGSWMIPGDPSVILIEFSEFSHKSDEIKQLLWEKFKIDSLNSSYHDFDKPIIWGFAVGKLLQKFKESFSSKNVIAHCHEWLSGGALLYLKAHDINIKTVFTTHATMLGRTLAGSRDDFYNGIQEINADEEAYKLNIHSKHQTEKACAKYCDIFTTVSEITSLEANHFLSREPDVLLPNGLDLSRFPTFDDASVAHRQFRTRMREFAIYFFLSNYDFNIDKTIFFFTAARYEFHGKGLDSIVEALAMLDERLKKENSEKNIVMFFFIPQPHKGIHIELLERKTFFEDVKESIILNQNQITENMLTNMISKESFNEKDIFSQIQIKELHKKIKLFKKDGNPLISTHIINTEHDPICQKLKEKNLLNLKSNKVKVIIYPIYLTGADSLLDLNYYESIIGGHLGIFPSYYEPWGYTPLETISNGVVTVTTDLAGFGRYVASNFKPEQSKGVAVLKRMGVSDNDFNKSLFDYLYNFTKLTKRQRIEKKISANELAEHFDWKNLVKNYFDAYKMALGLKDGA